MILGIRKGWFSAKVLQNPTILSLSVWELLRYVPKDLRQELFPGSVPSLKHPDELYCDPRDPPSQTVPILSRGTLYLSRHPSRPKTLHPSADWLSLPLFCSRLATVVERDPENLVLVDLLALLAACGTTGFVGFTTPRPPLRLARYRPHLRTGSFAFDRVEDLSIPRYRRPTYFASLADLPPLTTLTLFSYPRVSLDNATG